jgi:hypothetical protein
MRQKSIDDLEQKVFLRFHDRSWRIRRIGLALMCLLVVAAAIGLFGRGFLSTTTAQSSDQAVQARFDRFLHYAAPTELRVAISSPANPMQVSVSRNYLEQFELRSVLPDPDKVHAGENGLVFAFNVAGKPRETGVVFLLQPSRVGTVSGRLRVDDHSEIELRQFVYP